MRKPNQDEWSSIWQLFDTLVELPAHEHDARLGRDDVSPFIAEQVRSLLQADGIGGPLDAPLTTAQPDISAEYASLAAGVSVGAFRIVRLIGRGGMGEVYLAERVGSGFDQRVALKLLRPEAVARAALFDAERALLATLEHPGIARLIDGGIADDGRAYMAMEYVEGEDIGHWCSRRRSTVDDRLKLFLELCDAVSYAHARLVVHRDIKLANILVDDDGRARLLDFGIARIVDETSDHTMTMALLTPDTAAPEQLRNTRPTVATDVYALGAVLYELMTGTGPWRAGGGSVSSMIRRALHDDPAPPSRTAREQDESPVPSKRIEGDLDAIILKAMRNVASDRYASVADLADDVRRHQNLRPVRAHDGSTSYRLRRFIQRNTWGVLSGAALALALLAGAAGIVWQGQKAATERDIARAELRRSEAAFNAMTFLFRNASESGQIESATARDMLNTSARTLIATSPPGDPATAESVLTLADLYILTEDMAGAETFLRSAMDAGIGKRDRAMTARMQQRMGQTLVATGKPDEAKILLDAAGKIFRTDPARFRAETQDLVASRATLLRATGKPEEAVKLLETSLPDAELAYADNPRELLTRYGNLAVYYVEANRLADADKMLSRAETLAKRANMMATAPGLAIQLHRATTQAIKGDFTAGLQGYRRVAELRRELYGPSAGLGFSLLQKGGMELALGRDKEALASVDEAKTLIDNFLGAGTAPGVIVRMTRVEALANLGRVAEAERELAIAEAGLTKLGASPPGSAPFLRARAALRMAQGRDREAKADLAEARRLLSALGPIAAPSLAIVKQMESRLR